VILLALWFNILSCAAIFKKNSLTCEFSNLSPAPGVVAIPNLSEFPNQDEIDRVVLAEKQDGINRSALRTRFKVLLKEADTCANKKK
jgi:hypothetical protein